VRTLLKRLLDHEISRREFGQSMLALGFSAATVRAALGSAGQAAADSDGTEFVGTGGEVLAECLRAAGVRYVFNSNSTGQGPFYDALAARPDLDLIVALDEGQATAMAEGYQLASGSTAILSLPSIGMPNAMSNLYNAWKDRSSIAVFSDGQSSRVGGRDGFQQLDDWLQPTETITKWRWQVEHPERIGEFARRAIKIAGTPPGGPVYVRLPKDILGATDLRQAIYPQASFTVSLDMQPKPEVIERAARLLLAAKSPLINAGGEVTRSGARGDLVELAELLSIPVAQGHSVYGDFPFGHPLFAGFSVGGAPRGLREADLYLNLGGDMPDAANFGLPVPDAAAIVDVRVEFDKLASLYPTDLPVAAGVRETIRAVIDAVNGMATKSRLESIRAGRLEQSRAANEAAAERRRQRNAATWNDSPMSTDRVLYEADRALEPDAIIVPETTGRNAYSTMDFGQGRKTVIGPTTGFALGWGLGAALGVKIARPDHQVVAVLGDGALLFGQLEGLWTAARYAIPILIVVLNNRSYDSERQALFMTSPVAKANQDRWKDMACYLGDPAIDFVRIAQGFGIEGTTVSRPDDLAAAIARAGAATRAGQPYLIDAIVARTGGGAESTWHPDISIAKRRTRKV
jgi:benzoylformate decarboxylase